MDPDVIRNCICEAIVETQSLSGLECPPLSGTTIPARDVQDFKSEIWPWAISIIEDKTDISIPNEENLFYDDATKERLSIDQCVEKVLLIAKKNEKKEAVND